ncbi:restriction endonuclease subunit S [Veillonella atypica]|uniref:restriction endonuclease subunit S n=1 Tax=Veillonella atypica TaxID=39777 RepID=UPI002E772A29|nr:restriction endonuclease subunit S [Veillonella atypica]
MNKEKRRVPKLRFPGFTEDWEQRKLGEIVNSYSGGTPTASNKEYYGGDIPFIRSAEINSDSTELYITQKGLDNSSAKIVEKGTILYAMYGATSGEVGISKINGAINQAILAMIPLEYNGKIIAQYLRKNKESITGKYLQGGQGNLSANIILELPIQLPGLEESNQIANFLESFDNIITLHQRKLEHLNLKKKALLQKLFPKNGARYPELRFPGFTDAWEQRKLGNLYKRVNERNDGTLGRDKWISVAKMYFQDPDKVQSNNLDTRTYVMKKGDIAFEGHPNNEFKFGRFVLNDIGTGIISELFPIYRPITEYDLDFWKYAIQLERVMAPIFAKSITSSGNSSNKLDHNHFLNQELLVPNIDEQKKIGTLLSILSKNITLHQRKLEHLQLQKKALLQQMFV